MLVCSQYYAAVKHLCDVNGVLKVFWNMRDMETADIELSRIRSCSNWNGIPMSKVARASGGLGLEGLWQKRREFWKKVEAAYGQKVRPSAKPVFMYHPMKTDGITLQGSLRGYFSGCLNMFFTTVNLLDSM